ncbi:MAG: ketopantoate reductase family protein [Syntrophobacteraceae bacterium]
MHLLILGAGAMGSLIGARLSRTEAKVAFLETNRGHVDAIREHGLLIDELDGSKTRYFLKCHDDPVSVKDSPDLVLVAVKTYSTQAAVSTILNRCNAKTLFLTLQNGIGNWESIADIVGADRVLVGVTAQGCTLLEPGRIRHGGNGTTFIGEPEGAPSERVQSIVELFRSSGLDTQAGASMEELIWHKLIINVGINAITALTGIRNGVIARSEPAGELCRAAVEEAMLVAKAKEVSIPEDMVQRVFSVAQSTAVNRSSMGQDIDRRKPTEIDAINGAVVRMGDHVAVPTPVNRTLTRLVKVLEASFNLQ